MRFPPKPGHVRTARLVAVAVARRSGIGDERLDEVRLAVGEACARAVGRCLRAGCTQPIVVGVHETPGRLVVDVADEAGGPAADDEQAEPVVLALLAGLADSVDVRSGADGGASRIRLEWRLAAER